MSGGWQDLLRKARRAWASSWFARKPPPRPPAETVLVGDHTVRLDRGLASSAFLSLRPRPLPVPPEVERARQARRRLTERGTEPIVTTRGLRVRWKGPAVPDGLLEDMVDALPLCVPVVVERSYPVNRSALEALGVGLEQPVSGRVLDVILWIEGSARRALRRSDVQLELGGGWLHARWSGPLYDQDMLLEQLQELGTALAAPTADPWREIDRHLRARTFGACHTLTEFALGVTGPLRDRVLPVLMAEHDYDHDWEIIRTQGQFDDWLRFACHPTRSVASRLSAAEHLMLGTPAQRCRAAPQLFETPALRQEACVLLEGLVGPEAEDAWLALGAQTEEPDLLLQIVAGLGETGTARAMPWLRDLRGGLGPLQFPLKELVDTAMRDIRERCGATPGALSVAGPVPEQGALSVAAEGGRLSPLPDQGEP
jgi:hypothetical protein